MRLEERWMRWSAGSFVRLPIFARVTFVVLASLGLLFNLIDQLANNTPLWFRLVLGIPLLALHLWLGITSILILARWFSAPFRWIAAKMMSRAHG